ncbi:MAG TPA: hypothetical protein VKA50_00865 [Gammaproteobacteria bacterium]|nr:hypothetical protein [Gammaproteobacteria bacterium]
MNRLSTAWLRVAGLAAALVLVPAANTRADQLVNDDLIVTGNTCIGVDCADGESFFSTSELKLKENNLRLRLIDTTATGTPGQTWSLMANESINGGASFFSFALQPIDTDPSVPDDLPPTHVLRTGVAAANSTAIGMNSELVNDTVSVGSAGILRRLVHVAKALSDTEALIKHQLDEGGLGGREATADALEAQVTALENQVTRLENELGSSGGSGAIGPVYLLLFATLAAFAVFRRARLRSS